MSLSRGSFLFVKIYLTMKKHVLYKEILLLYYIHLFTNNMCEANEN